MTPLVVQLPIGVEDGFTGVVDLVGMRALTWADGVLHEQPATRREARGRRGSGWRRPSPSCTPAALEEFGRHVRARRCVRRCGT